jgi:hypothetical protein
LGTELGPDPELSAVVGMLCDEGRLVRDRPVGGRSSNAFRYRLWEEVFPEVSLAAWDETAATTALVGLYLEAYGPVSRADVVWWTGLPAKRVDAALDGLGDQVRTVAVAGLGDRLLMTSGDLAPATSVEDGVAINLLPMLDPYTMGYPDRTRFLDPRMNDVVIDRGGNVTSVVLVDGESWASGTSPAGPTQPARCNLRGVSPANASVTVPQGPPSARVASSTRETTEPAPRHARQLSAKVADSTIPVNSPMASSVALGGCSPPAPRCGRPRPRRAGFHCAPSRECRITPPRCSRGTIEVYSCTGTDLPNQNAAVSAARSRMG